MKKGALNTGWQLGTRWRQLWRRGGSWWGDVFLLRHRWVERTVLVSGFLVVIIVIVIIIREGASNPDLLVEQPPQLETRILSELEALFERRESARSEGIAMPEDLW